MSITIELVIDPNTTFETSGVAVRWGAMVGASEARGQPVPVIESLIAATSLQHDLTIVSRNTDDLERCGGRCFNPWVGK